MTRAEKRKADVAAAKETIDGLASPEMMEVHGRFLGVKLEDFDKEDLIKALAWVGFRQTEDNRNTR